ncbi:carbohydrate kinase family protein [Silvibacterium acidisoli]|uniref:carbohydrate kinase family protein n=1 Tax=Acidobacteriaceae bacterium ZG23-2 TaxID=2883246 RepID=UPI00406CD74C
MPSFDITIAGEINLDLILYGLPEEMATERELLGDGFEVTLGSSSAILAHNLATLGISTGFITRVGHDEFGQIALERMRAAGVDLSKVVESRTKTKTGVTILLPHGGHRHILTYPGTMVEMTRADLDMDYLASSRHFHLSSLFLLKGLEPDFPAIFRELKSRGLTLSLDTNDDPADEWGGVLRELLPMVDILLPNRGELCRMMGRDTVEAALDDLVGVVPLVAVKCGSEGALVQVGRERVKVPGLKVTATDTIGAGDSFNSGFLAAWLSGANPVEAAAAANITGALSTQRPGGTEAFREVELRESFLQKHGFPAVRSRQQVQA